MNKASTFKYLGMATVALLLAACGDQTAEIKALSKKMKLSKPEVAAFNACVKDIGGKKPIFITASTDPEVPATAVRMNKVPLEVCACQSRTMAKLFKDDKLKGHEKFAGYIIKQKRKPTLKLGRKDVKQGVDPEKGGLELVTSLQSCASGFSAAYAEAEGSNLMDPYELPKKKKKKKPEGEAAKGDAAAGDAAKGEAAKKPDEKKAKKS